MSSDWLIHKYIGFLSPRLEKFRRKGNNLYNFRCPFCGDSSSRKNLARGFIYMRQDKLMFHCHNGCTGMSASNFLKTIDQNLYNEYNLEKLRDHQDPKQVALDEFVDKMKTPIFMKSGPLKGLKKISQLSPDSNIKKYIVNRNIPNEFHAKIFSCPNFFKYVNTIIPGKFSNNALNMDETRVVIPFFDKHKNVHAFQGRSIYKNSQVKYITIVLNNNIPSIYGLETLDEDKEYIVVEGPFDAMFLKNTIATAGGDLVTSITSLNKKNAVICYDNESRSKDTIKKIEKAIYNGYKVCIWPNNFQHKDVNDAINSGLSSEFIEYIIRTNTYQDLRAKMTLTQWRKI